MTIRSFTSVQSDELISKWLGPRLDDNETPSSPAIFPDIAMVIYLCQEMSYHFSVAVESFCGCRFSYLSPFSMVGWELFDHFVIKVAFALMDTQRYHLQQWCWCWTRLHNHRNYWRVLSFSISFSLSKCFVRQFPPTYITNQFRCITVCIFRRYTTSLRWDTPPSLSHSTFSTFFLPLRPHSLNLV